MVLPMANVGVELSIVMPCLNEARTLSSCIRSAHHFLEQSDVRGVIGNRFLGGIEPGAMPLLHRYIGNPFLSMLGRTIFPVEVGDFHCGLRGFDRARILALALKATGMEFASEMIVRSALAGYKIVEVPTILRKDGRDRPPHLRTWSDGWKHLRFLLDEGFRGRCLRAPP
jgi:hypothetical protein